MQVGPLITMPRENLTGELAESYVQLTYWYSKVYDKNILGLQEVWGRFAGVVTQTTDGGNPDLRFNVIALPESLKPDAKLVPTRFANTNSRLVGATGFDLTHYPPRVDASTTWLYLFENLPRIHLLIYCFHIWTT